MTSIETFNSRLKKEERISKLEGKLFEIIQLEEHKEKKRMEKTRKPI